jgi:hypothetical protein
VTTSSRPSPVTGVKTDRIYKSSGTFSSLEWEVSTSPDVLFYLVTWESNDTSGTQEVSVPASTTKHDWPIDCNVLYVYRVAAVNPCGTGPPSAPVQQLCNEVPPAQRVALQRPDPASSESGPALSLSFTINYLELVKWVRVDVEEQDDNFVPRQTLNYSLSEDLYKGGSVCVAALTPGAHYLVCLRVNYTDTGVDSSCSRAEPVKEEEAPAPTASCQLPTSSRQVADPEGTASSASECQAPAPVAPVCDPLSPSPRLGNRGHRGGGSAAGRPRLLLPWPLLRLPNLSE